MSKLNSLFVNAVQYNLKLKRLKLFTLPAQWCHTPPSRFMAYQRLVTCTDSCGRLSRGMVTSWLTCSSNSPYSMDCAINQTELIKHWCFVL
jgi:hypothetical protein